MSQFIFILSILKLTYGLYFELEGFEKVQFIKDVPESTIILGHYICELRNLSSNKIKASPPGTCVHIQTFDPNRKLILSKIYGGKGSFSFLAHISGEHFISISLPVELKYESGVIARIHLDVVSGEQSLDFLKIKQQEKLSDLEMKYRQLLEQIRDVQKEQDYQRLRETHFRRTSENTNLCVIAFAILQTCLLIVVRILQTKHLKRFFKQKKLV